MKDNPMIRNYSNDADTEANFFLGTEIEHSPARGMKTLFVVGVHPFEEIKKVLSDPFVSAGGAVEHIYFGANMSFPRLAVNDFENWSQWESMIDSALDAGYYCTLDIDVSCAEGLLESGLTENSRFIPMISVKLPYVQLLGYNATIKIDDRGFESTNPGVWCHSLHNLMDRAKFTAWSEYAKDSKLC